MVYVSLLFSLLMICKGGDWFVDAAAGIAEAFGIPKYVIGATIVSFATTMPEMIVSVAAALQGQPVMAIGNAVGSVSANTGLILGISLVCIPAAVKRKEYLTKTVLYLGSLLLLFISFLDGKFTTSDSVLLLLAGILFLIINAHSAVKSGNITGQEYRGKRELAKKGGFFLLGAASIVVGSQLLIDSSCEIARIFGIPENVISVTIVAMGTSLPEFITTITAIIKKESALSVGNIVGANMIDTAFILPVCTLLKREALPVSAVMQRIDMPVCVVLGAAALLPMLFREKIRRADGIVVIGIYLLYFFYITVLL